MRARLSVRATASAAHALLKHRNGPVFQASNPLKKYFENGCDRRGVAPLARTAESASAPFTQSKGQGLALLRRESASVALLFDQRTTGVRYTLRPIFRTACTVTPNHMDPIYLTGIVGLAGALSTLLGVAITSHTQVANQTINNEFQLALAQQKAQDDHLAKFSETAAAQLAIAHKLLSYIGREFSVTGLNIMWTKTMSVDDFNAKYMALCEKADELLMVVDFHAPEASERCREIYGQMNLFWGNFGNVLYLTAAGKKVDHDTDCFRQAHDAAREIGEKSVFAKSILRRTFESHFVAAEISSGR